MEFRSSSLDRLAPCVKSSRCLILARDETGLYSSQIAISRRMREWRLCSYMRRSAGKHSTPSRSTARAIAARRSDLTCPVRVRRAGRRPARRHPQVSAPSVGRRADSPRSPTGSPTPTRVPNAGPRVVLPMSRRSPLTEHLSGVGVDRCEGMAALVRIRSDHDHRARPFNRVCSG
jgi:hypothetical protein